MTNTGAQTRTFTTEIEGKTLEIGLGRLAQNAAASCTIRYGDTVLLMTVCEGDPRPGLDFFPLTVDYEERMYAIGKIPGSFFRREGRPGTDATLTARMTDRPIRPLFPKGYRREVQVVLTLLSSDRQNPGDVWGTTAASIVLGMSKIPFSGPVSSVRVARVEGELIAFPTYEQIAVADLDLTVAGTEASVVMIEAGASGDFYGIDQHRDRILRLDTLGKVVRAFAIPREPAPPNGKIECVRVCEKKEILFLLVSGGGILGRVSKLNENYVTLEVAQGVEMTLQRSAIQVVLPKGTIKNIE